LFCVSFGNDKIPIQVFCPKTGKPINQIINDQKGGGVKHGHETHKYMKMEMEMNKQK